MPDVPLRTAVLGLGLMGHRHGAALAANPTAELAAGVDLSGDARDRFAAAFGVPTVAELDELRPGDIDAVVVSLPDALHRAPTVRALEAGWHVLVEKPLATTLDDAHAIVDAARRAGTVVMVGHTLRFDPRYRERARPCGRVGSVTSRSAMRGATARSAPPFGMARPPRCPGTCRSTMSTPSPG